MVTDKNCLKNKKGDLTMKKIASVLAMILVLAMATSAFAATGLGSVTTVATTAATESANGSVSVNTTICALTVDENGVIVGIKMDAIQPKGAFTATGEAASEDGEVTPKVALQEGYGMRKASAIGAEWFEQAAAFEAWCIGKTVEEVLATPTMDKGDGHHTQVPTDVDLTAGCTIDIGDFKVALSRAYDNAMGK